MSTLTPEVLRKYMNKMFVETGTYEGEGTQIALDVGFERVLTVEAVPDLAIRALEKFGDTGKVRVFHGRSEDVLWYMIKDVAEPITFWLDAHFNTSPLMQELAIIAQHPVKTHTILMDDVRLFGEYGITVEQVEKFLLTNVNAGYKFYREPNFVRPDDILVAKVG